MKLTVRDNITSFHRNHNILWTDSSLSEIVFWPFEFFLLFSSPSNTMHDTNAIMEFMANIKPTSQFSYHMCALWIFYLLLDLCLLFIFIHLLGIYRYVYGIVRRAPLDFFRCNCFSNHWHIVPKCRICSTPFSTRNYTLTNNLCLHIAYISIAIGNLHYTYIFIYVGLDKMSVSSAQIFNRKRKLRTKSGREKK